ncbi:MAG: DUF4159 domain-containing protein [Gemmatimonadetes bacterium]|nr:DUF4159 domain-containing protein [Gemmatimonadota bacterium]
MSGVGLTRAKAGGPGSDPENQRTMSAQDFGNVDYDGRFTFVRIRYATGLSGGSSFGRRRQAPWAHDFPRAERNFMEILKETTFIAPFMNGSNVFATDEAELTKYPLAYLSEPGYWVPSEEEVEGLRNYLLKGGFLIADDFRGWDWQNFEAQMKRVLPDAQFVQLDESHPIFDSFFRIESLATLTSYGRELPSYWGLFEDNDPEKRLVVIANYNNDIGEYWEFSDVGYYPIDLSNEAYKLGVNYVIYAMTH